MQVPAGGPATINGIIYQMLWSLIETSSIQIRECDADASGERVTHAFVILEPIGGGGDTLVCSENVTTVQQLKAKSDGGTWSFRSLVYDVLPDLYRAVDLENEQQFQFITEGRQGDWKQAEDFFIQLASRPLPDDVQDVLATLDADRKIRFHGSLTDDKNGLTELSEPELFAQFVTVLREKAPAKQEQVSLTHRKLWKLLSHLGFHWEETSAKLRVLIMRRLRAVIDNTDSLEDTLGSLLMALAERASHGDEPIEAVAFFREHGLDATPLNKWQRIVKISAKCLAAALSSHHYHPDADARTPPEMEGLSFWQPDVSPFLVLAGESGQGKTWRLCSLARIVSEDAPVVLLSATGDGGRDIEKAARLFWQNTCGHGGVLSLDMIARRVGAEVPTRAGNWLFLFVDNVLTVDEAKSLYEELTHVTGVCVAFTASPEVANSFAAYARGKAQIVRVPDFTDDELRSYVTGDDLIRWHRIPDDIRETIRRPLLASLYRDLTHDGTWTADTEYDLFSRYYQKHVVAEISQRFRMVLAPMEKAAIAVWEAQDYPWAADQLFDFGFQNEPLDELVRIGWLRFNDNRCEIWHDRLLNWQVAEALGNALLRRQMDPMDVGKRCADLLWSDSPDRQRGLSYVAMDLVWLLAQRGQPAADILDTILHSLDRGYYVARGLYEELLPTIGASIAPAMFRRLGRVEEPDRNLARMEIVKTLSALAAVAVAPDAIRLLFSTDTEMRRAGAEILSCRPSKLALDPLWHRYCVLLQQDKLRGIDTNDDSARDNLQERIDLWPALTACIALDSGWLEAKIQQANPHIDSVGSMAALLAHPPGGKELWRNLKTIIRNKIGAEDERQFADAIYHWRDVAETQWLRERVYVARHGTGASCLRALIRTAPDIALSALADIAPEELYLTREWTFGDIMGRCPVPTRQRMCTLMREHPDRLGEYADAFASFWDAMDEAIVKLLICDLYPRLETGTVDSIWRDVRRLEGINRLPLLRCLWGCAGTDWEAQLTRLVIERGPLPTFWRNITLEDTVNVLYKLDGDGFTQVINHWLAGSEPSARLSGILRAFQRPNATTIGLLEDIALDRLAGDSPDVDHHSHEAQKSLAACGAWKSVVTAIVHWQENSNRDVLIARHGAGPLSDDEMLSAFEALRSDPKHPGAIIALGFGRRVDYIDFIVATLNEEDTSSYSKVTNACIWALLSMERFTPEGIEAMIGRLDCSEGRWLVIHGLCLEGGEKAARALLGHLRNEFAEKPVPSASRPNVDENISVARHVLRHQATSENAVALCRERLSRGQALDSFSMELVRELVGRSADYEAYRAVLDSQRVRDFLAREAFRQESNVRIVGHKATSILGLAAFGREEAYVAALRVLQNPKAADREYAPYMLLDLDRERALEDIIVHLAHERQASEQIICARALCGAGSQDVLLRHITATDAKLRRAACFVLGFAEPTDTVTEAVRKRLDDDDVSVYEAAIASLHRLGKAQDARELADALHTESDNSRRWVLLDAALEIGEVGDIDRAAPEWLQTMCAHLPPLMRHYANDKLTERRKLDMREAKEVDQRNRSD